MKRCPECRRDYYDETLLYCLEKGMHSEAIELNEKALPALRRHRVRKGRPPAGCGEDRREI
jgi:hypothetical protein